MPSNGPINPAAGASAVSSAGALQDCLTSAVLVVDRGNRIVACTLAAAKALHLKAGKPALPAKLRKLVRDCFATGEPVPAQTISAPAKSAQATLTASASPVNRGRTTEVIIVIHDLAPLHHFENHLRRLDRLASIGTLSASMGHEIKNALVAVKTFIDLLLEKNQDAELTEVVRREMLRIDSIASQMLKFAGPGRPTFSAVRVHDVLDHSLRLVQHKLEGKLISLNRAFNAAPDAIKGDDYQLEQAFVNLLLNAVEAMGPNGSLQVATESVTARTPGAATAAEGKSAPHVRVTISDTGVGVAPENMSHLFEPFFTTKHNGTGLGLPIAQRIVREHHGDITVHSEVNKGTTFNILLPTSVKVH